jgi:DNA-binding transcriptional LysR family regulator
VVPDGHALAAREAVTPADLAGARLIALPRRFALRAGVDRAFRQAGLAPAIAMEAATSLFAAEMVRRGLGIAILNPVPLAALYPDLAFRPFRPAIPIETLVVTPQGAPPHPALGAFVAALRGVLEGGALDLAQDSAASAVAGTAERPIRQEMG